MLRAIVGRAAAPGHDRLGQLTTSFSTPASSAVGLERESASPVGAAVIAGGPRDGQSGWTLRGTTGEATGAAGTWLLHPCHWVVLAVR